MLKEARSNARYAKRAIAGMTVGRKRGRWWWRARGESTARGRFQCQSYSGYAGATARLRKKRLRRDRVNYDSGRQRTCAVDAPAAGVTTRLCFLFFLTIQNSSLTFFALSLSFSSCTYPEGNLFKNHIDIRLTPLVDEAPPVVCR